MFEVVNTLTETQKKENLVAIGSYLNDGIPEDSVIVIKFQEKLEHIFFNGNEIYYGRLLDDTCYHKITDTIDPKLIPSFIVMCRRIKKKANPLYGYFYSGEYYDKNGDHFSENSISQSMTCSGFCLNILKGFLEEEYLKYWEWNKPTDITENFLENFASKYNFEVEDIADSHRRISPLELLCSAFFKNLPISKDEIYTKIDEIEMYLGNVS